MSVSSGAVECSAKTCRRFSSSPFAFLLPLSRFAFLLPPLPPPSSSFSPLFHFLPPLLLPLVIIFYRASPSLVFSIVCGIWAMLTTSLLCMTRSIRNSTPSLFLCSGNPTSASSSPSNSPYHFSSPPPPHFLKGFVILPFLPIFAAEYLFLLLVHLFLLVISPLFLRLLLLLMSSLIVCAVL